MVIKKVKNILIVLISIKENKEDIYKELNKDFGNFYKTHIFIDVESSVQYDKIFRNMCLRLYTILTTKHNSIPFFHLRYQALNKKLEEWFDDLKILYDYTKNVTISSGNGDKYITAGYVQSGIAGPMWANKNGEQIIYKWNLLSNPSGVGKLKVYEIFKKRRIIDSLEKRRKCPWYEIEFESLSEDETIPNENGNIKGGCGECADCYISKCANIYEFASEEERKFYNMKKDNLSFPDIK